MEVEQGIGGEPELTLEDRKYGVVHCNCLEDERPDSGLNACIDGGRVGAQDDVWVRERVVLGNGDGLDSVKVTVFICSIRTCVFVAGKVWYLNGMYIYNFGVEDSPGGHAAFSLLELHLLLEWKEHRLLAHIKHTVNFFISTMIL